MGLSIGNGLANDLLMPEMHAVEKADRQAHLLRAGLQFGWTVYDAHQPNLVGDQ